MDLVLDTVEVRVLGALMEKEAATPEYYPLTLNSLRAACNQKTNRDPVLALDEDSIATALDSLRAKGLTRDISGAGHRVHKYGHRVGEVFNFDRREQAIICALMLRGPQTVGELRGRTERLYTFDDLSAVETTLERLSEREPPIATRLPRRPGEKESRFAHLLGGEVDTTDITLPLPAQSSPLAERVARLEEEFAVLRSQFDEFRGKFE